MWSELDRCAAAVDSSWRSTRVFVAWLGLATLIAACSSSSRGGDAVISDAGDSGAADHPNAPDAGDALGDHASNDRFADAGEDAVPMDGPVSDGGPSDTATSDVAIDGGPATPVAVQVAIASAPAFAGWRASCVASDSDATDTNTCWVIQWHQWTYWALTNIDNREAFLIVGVDGAGNHESAGFERMGTRYLWQATVDSTAMTVSYFGQGGVTVISWADLDEEPPPLPEASEAAIELAPTVAGWSASCVYSSADTTLTDTCAVVKWGQWTYWALSNANNDQSLYIVGVDTTGAVNPSGGLTKAGTRYVWKVAVDGSARTATFYGQAGNNIAVTFDELRIDQP